MIKRMLNMSVKNRILSIFLITSITLVTLLIAAFIYIEVNNTYERFTQLSRQTANSLSHLPVLNNAIDDLDIAEIEGVINRTKLSTENPTISIVNRDARYIYHYDDSIAGTFAEEDEFTSTLLFGSLSTENVTSQKGNEIRTIAPVLEEVHGGERIIGAVAVSYLSSDINSSILNKVLRLSFVAIIGVIISFLGAIWLQRSIQSDTLGYEPATIARMFKERNAIISTVREGIIMLDKSTKITFSNPSAKSVLVQLSEEEVIHLFKLKAVIQTGVSYYDKEVRVNDNTYIINCLPIFEDNNVSAAICSFRDKTDFKQLQDSLQQITSYSDDLRAQSHEFKNKIHVLHGLLRIEKYDEAIDFINEEKFKDESTIPALKHIKDAATHAILLGKMAKANEKGICINIDENSMLERTHISVSDMATMLGNLLDNAIEAVNNNDSKIISVLITDIGKDIIIDIEDNGSGISKKESVLIMDHGHSSKGDNRGYGLTNVNLIAKKYGGFLTFHSDKGIGSIFSLYIPKEEF